MSSSPPPPDPSSAPLRLEPPWPRGLPPSPEFHGQVLLVKSVALPPVSLSELGYKSPFAQLRNPIKETHQYLHYSPEPKPRWNPKPEQIRILEAIFNFEVVNPPRDEIRKIRAQMQEQ
ncbi:hypothetical protein COP2_035662 [Malus domestica]